MRSLNDATFVAGQVTHDDLSAAAEANVKVLVNHRTPGEELGQPSSENMATMAADAGMRYLEIPVAGIPSHEAAVRTL